MDALLGELTRKKEQSQSSTTKNLKSLQLLDNKNNRTKQTGKFMQLKEDAKMALLRGKDKDMAPPTSTPDELSQEQQWFLKSQEAMARKTALYEEQLRKAAAENNFETFSSDEGADNLLDTYGDYLQKIKIYKREEKKSGLLVDFSKKIQQTLATKAERPLTESPLVKNDAVLPTMTGAARPSGLIAYEDEFGRVREVSALEYEQLMENRSIVTRPEPLIDNETTTKHYDPDWEVRTRGVGFFAFSKDELERQTQIQDLKNLDKEFKEERKKVSEQTSVENDEII